MSRIAIGAAAAAFLSLLSLSPASAKTIRECDAEYTANKAAIQGVQIKGAFVTACRAGTEVIPGVAPTAVATPAPMAPVAAAPVAVAPSPVVAAPPPAAAPPVRTGLFGRKVAPAPSVAAPLSAAAPSAANQFAAADQAQGRCPGTTIVWVNTESGVYHFAGTRNFGKTKAGAYMCEADATAAGDRASKTEKHP